MSTRTPRLVPPGEMKLKIAPGFDFDQAQTAKRRAASEDFAKKNNAQIWIQYD